MVKNCAFSSSIGGIILLENRPESPLSVMGIVSLFTILMGWVFSSWVLSTLLKKLRHLPLNLKESNNAGSTASTPSGPCLPDHDNADDADNNLYMGEVEVELVMGKLGICLDPSGGELKQSVGLEDIEALFEEGEVGLEEVREAFDVFDENSDGFIDESELEKVLSKLGFKGVSGVECRRMIAAFDENGDGGIDFCEFVKLLESS